MVLVSVVPAFPTGNDWATLASSEYSPFPVGHSGPISWLHECLAPPPSSLGDFRGCYCEIGANQTLASVVKHPFLFAGAPNFRLERQFDAIFDGASEAQVLRSEEQRILNFGARNKL